MTTLDGYPCIRGVDKIHYPADDSGLIFRGKRWKIGRPPSREEIDEAKRVFVSVPKERF